MQDISISILTFNVSHEMHDLNEQKNNIKAYLPGAGDTVINKAVPLDRGPSIALRLG